MLKNLTPKYINSIINEYSQNVEYMQDKEITLIAVERSPSLLAYSCESLKNDREVVLKAVKSGGSALQYASMNLRADSEVALAAVSDFVGSYAFVLPPATDDEKIIETVARSGSDTIELLPDTKKDDISVAMLAVRKNPKAVRFFSERVRADETVAQEVIKADRTAIKYLSDEAFLNKQVYEAAKSAYKLGANANALSNDVPLGFLVAMRTFNEKLNLASQNFDLIKIDRDKLSVILDIYSGVIVRRGELFRKYVDLDDKEIVAKFIDLKLITPAAAQAEVKYAVKNSKRRVLPILISYSHKSISRTELSERDKLIKSLKRGSFSAIERLRENIDAYKEDSEVILLALKVDGNLLVDLSGSSLLKDEEILNEGLEHYLVKSSDLPIAERLSGVEFTKDQAITACKKDGRNYYYLSEELRSDIDVLAEAVRFENELYESLPEELKNNPKILLKRRR